jgi:VWFA-related protein
MLPRALPLLFLLVFAAAARAQEPVTFQLTVERLIVDAHVTDDAGNPILELGPNDFVVTIDGKPVKVESADWVRQEEAALYGVEEKPRRELSGRRGRLLVFFFQTDFQRASTRVSGQVRMIEYAQRFLEGLGPDDRVAVVSHDTHLKLIQDFTSDRERLRHAIRESIRIKQRRGAEIVPSPSLAARLDPEEARKAARPEKALFLIGNALLPIDGPKTLVLFGWGLGHLTSFGVVDDKSYFIARRALEESRTSVFSLDISDADWHSLEVGLEKVSKQTGGFYAKTHLFPQFAMDKLRRTISGHYEIVVNTAGVPPGFHKVEVTLAGRRGNVYARTTFSNIAVTEEPER